MTGLDQSLPLTDAERAILGTKRTRALIMAPAMAAAAILVLALLVGLLLAGVFSLFLITLLLVSFVCGAKALLSTFSFARLNRDLREGQKRFINAPVEAQDMTVPQGGGSSSAYTFWIKAAGRKIEVSEEQYYQVKKGDLVQAYVAPHSGTVFGLTKDGSAGAVLGGNHAAAGQFTPARQPLNRNTKRLIVASAVVVVAAVLFVAVGGIAVMSMSEKTYNSLNPFAPKPPAGAFAENIGNFKKDAMYYTDDRRYGSGYSFSSTYKSNEAATVSYVVVDYGSPEKAKVRLRDRYYLSADLRIVQQTENRAVASAGSREGVMVMIAAGKYLVRISGKTKAAIDFENHLPYAAFGMSQPPPRTVDDLKETAIPVASMLDEFARDKIAAATKYDGKTFLFSGTIANPATKGLNNSMLVSIQKPVTNESKSGSVTASFPTSEAGKLEKLTVGQSANLRCRVFAFKDTRNFSILENCKLE